MDTSSASSLPISLSTFFHGQRGLCKILECDGSPEIQVDQLKTITNMMVSMYGQLTMCHHCAIHSTYTLPSSSPNYCDSQALSCYGTE